MASNSSDKAGKDHVTAPASQPQSSDAATAKIARETPPQINVENYDDGDASGVNVLPTSPPAYTDVVGANTSLPAPSEQERSSYRAMTGVPVLMGPRLDSEPAYLEDSIRALAPVPPQLLVRLRGTHREKQYRHQSNGKTQTSQEIVTDFDVSLDLTAYLLDRADPVSGLSSSLMELRTVSGNVKTYRGTVLKRRMWEAPPSACGDAECVAPAMDLHEWCRRYCESSSPIKIFRVTRKVTGLNERFLDSRLRELAQRANYRGHVEVTFPLNADVVDVYSDCRVNRWRLLPPLVWFFYVSFLWLISWPVLFLATKRWSVVEVIWPFSYVDGAGRTKYASVSEQAWYEQWRRAIERAVLRKQCRMLTAEDLAEADRENGARLQRSPSGSEVVDSAVRLVGAVSNGLSEVNQQIGWGYDDH